MNKINKIFLVIAIVSFYNLVSGNFLRKIFPTIKNAVSYTTKKFTLKTTSSKVVSAFVVTATSAGLLDQLYAYISTKRTFFSKLQEKVQQVLNKKA